MMRMMTMMTMTIMKRSIRTKIFIMVMTVILTVSKIPENKTKNKIEFLLLKNFKKWKLEINSNKQLN
jgi:hypothetical protein